jgi:hypothetical protein
VRLIAKNVKTNPLNGLKNDQNQQKQQHTEQRNGIGYDFLHETKLINKNTNF